MPPAHVLDLLDAVAEAIAQLDLALLRDAPVADGATEDGIAASTASSDAVASEDSTRSDA